MHSNIYTVNRAIMRPPVVCQNPGFEHCFRHYYFRQKLARGKKGLDAEILNRQPH